jgi:hypothetical protein
VLRLEIADPDRPDPALVTQMGERLEGVDEFMQFRHRPVHQVEVKIIDPQVLHADVECRQGALVTLLGIPQFGDQVKFVSVHPGLGDRTAGFAFVAVHCRGINVAVPGLQRGAHRLPGVRGRDLENAESDRGDGMTVVERD